MRALPALRDSEPRHHHRDDATRPTLTRHRRHRHYRHPYRAGLHSCLPGRCIVRSRGRTSTAERRRVCMCLSDQATTADAPTAVTSERRALHAALGLLLAAQVRFAIKCLLS